MLARIKPETAPKGKRSEVAAAYGLTVAEFKRHFLNFVNSEGFDDHGNEYDTLHDYLTSAGPEPAAAPFQKGDEYPDMSIDAGEAC